MSHLHNPLFLICIDMVDSSKNRPESYHSRIQDLQTILYGIVEHDQYFENDPPVYEKFLGDGNIFAFKNLLQPAVLAIKLHQKLSNCVQSNNKINSSSHDNGIYVRIGIDAGTVNKVTTSSKQASPIEYWGPGLVSVTRITNF